MFPKTVTVIKVLAMKAENLFQFHQALRDFAQLK